MRWASATDQTRIEIDQSSYVMVYSRPSAARQAKVEKALFSMSDLESGSKEIGLSPTGQKIALIAAYLVSWHGPAFLNEKGKAVPCNRGSLESLDTGDDATMKFINLVADEIAKLHTPPAVDGDGDFLADGESG